MASYLLVRGWRVEKAGIGAVLLLAAFATVLATRPSVPIDAVDGRYENPCCSPIFPSRGVLVAGKARATYKLYNMKFGLTAYAKREVEVRGAEVLALPSKDETAILFSDDRRSFVLLDEGEHEYRFDKH